MTSFFYAVSYCHLSATLQTVRNIVETYKTILLCFEFLSHFWGFHLTLPRINEFIFKGFLRKEKNYLQTHKSTWMIHTWNVFTYNIHTSTRTTLISRDSNILYQLYGAVIRNVSIPKFLFQLQHPFKRRDDIYIILNYVERDKLMWRHFVVTNLSMMALITTELVLRIVLNRPFTSYDM